MKKTFAIIVSAMVLTGVAREAPLNFPVVGDLPPVSASDMTDFRRQADALYRMKEKAFAEADAETVVTRFYAANAISVGPEGKPDIGREAFRKSYEKVVKDSNVKVEPVSAFVGKSAAWEWANFRVIPKDPKEKPISLAIVFLFAKKGNRWICGGDAYVIGEFPPAAGVTRSQ